MEFNIQQSITLECLVKNQKFLSDYESVTSETPIYAFLCQLDKVKILSKICSYFLYLVQPK